MQILREIQMPTCPVATASPQSSSLLQCADTNTSHGNQVHLQYIKLKCQRPLQCPQHYNTPSCNIQCILYMLHIQYIALHFTLVEFCTFVFNVISLQCSKCSWINTFFEEHRAQSLCEAHCTSSFFYCSALRSLPKAALQTILLWACN